MEQRIVMIGMGYVGLTYALYLNDQNQKVIGVEINEQIRSKINKAELPFFEKGLDFKLKESRRTELLHVISPNDFIIDHSTPTIFIITVGTPIKNYSLDYTSINEVFTFLKKVVQPNDGVVLRSTISVGLTRKYCEELNKDLAYCFAPERTIEGNAVHELESLPQVFGANNLKSKKLFFSFFNRYHKEVLEVSSTEASEMVKLSSNVYRDVNFGFSNEIAKLAYFYGVNSSEIIDACNYKYPRCNIAKSGPVSGPCLTKDSYILLDKNEAVNSIILNARKLNEDYSLEILSDVLEKNSIHNSCIFGISFKGTPPTSDTRDSLAIQMVKFLKQKNITVSGYDPVVFQEDFEKLEIPRFFTIEEAIDKNDLIIIQNNNSIFSQIDFNRLVVNRKKTIIDFWSVVPDSNNINIDIIKI